MTIVLGPYEALVWWALVAVWLVLRARVELDTARACERRDRW